MEIKMQGFVVVFLRKESSITLFSCRNKLAKHTCRDIADGASTQCLAERLKKDEGAF